MKNRKLKIAVGSIALCAVMLATTACGPSTDGDPDTGGIDLTVDTRGTKIEMWTSFGAAYSEKLKLVLADFTELTGIEVEYTNISGYDNLTKAINEGATQMNYPHIANGYPDHFASYIKENILLRLDGMIANDGKRGNVEGAYTRDGVRYGADGVMLLNYEDFHDDYTYENETLEFDENGKGYVLGMPFNKSTEALVYNSKLFDWCEANEDLVKTKTGGTEIHVPTTWEEVSTYGKAIIKLLEGGFQNGTVSGKVLGSDGEWYASTDACESAGKSDVMSLVGVEKDQFYPLSYDSGANLFITMVRQFGGTYTSVDTSISGKGYIKFDSPETRNALNMIKRLMDEHVFAIPSSFKDNTTSYCSTPFKAGKSVINVSSTGGLSNIVSDAIPTKAAPLPYQDANKKYVISQGTSLGLFDKGTDVEKAAAFKLLVYLTQQANGKFASMTGYFPTCKFAEDSIDYQNYLTSKFKGPQQILEQSCSKINKETYSSWHRFTDPGFAGSSDIRNEVDKVPGYLRTGDKGDVNSIISFLYQQLADYKQ